MLQTVQDRMGSVCDATVSSELCCALSMIIQPSPPPGAVPPPPPPYKYPSGPPTSPPHPCLRLHTILSGMLQVIRHYHGHLSGVYSLALHPNLDLLMTGGRDSVCRVWDMRSKVQAHVLSGHDDTVCSILSQASDPQV